MDNITFFATLFDPDEYTCFASHIKGTRVYSVEQQLDKAHTWASFFCINPLHPTKDLNPTEEYHNVDKPRRADHNVIVYRNILVEMDSVPLDQQEGFIKNTGMPYSSAVYSGGKSIHYIVSLETPLLTETEYRDLTERVYKALGGKSVVDTSCKNPSRLSRVPNAFRYDKQQYQKLIHVGERIKNSDLEAWLVSKKVHKKEEKLNLKVFSDQSEPATYVSNGVISGFTLNFIMFGAPQGERNSSLFRAACDMFKCGYCDDDVYARLSGPSGLDNQEVLRTIKSAKNKVSK